MWIDKIVQNDNSSVFNRLLDLGYNAERHFYKTLLASQACAIVFLRRNPKYLDAFRAHVNLSNHAHAWAIQELNLMAGKQIPQNQTNTTDDCRNLFHT